MIILTPGWSHSVFEVADAGRRPAVATDFISIINEHVEIIFDDFRLCGSWGLSCLKRIHDRWFEQTDSPYTTRKSVPHGAAWVIFPIFKNFQPDLSAPSAKSRSTQTYSSINDFRICDAYLIMLSKRHWPFSNSVGVRSDRFGAD